MSIRKVNFVKGEYYHIYNRGNDKKIIFKDSEDYNHFIGLIYVCNQIDNFKSDNLKKDQGLLNFIKNTKLVDIGSYCLMPNHFHILITQVEEGSVTKFMQKLSTAYVMYYNKKYKKKGSLFEGKFKAEHVNNNRYLKYLFSYIHLNPVKLIIKDWKEKGIENKNEVLNYLSKYKYSSYLDFLGEDRIQNKILNIGSFPNYFLAKNKFKKEIFEWLSYSPRGKA